MSKRQLSPFLNEPGSKKLHQVVAKFPTRQEFHESALSQIFSLPKTLIHEIITNPSSAKGYNKIIQTCKLFYIKSPILVFDSLGVDNNKWIYTIEKEIKGSPQLSRPVDMYLDEERHSKIDAKLWLTKCLGVKHHYNDTIVPSLIIPRIYRCEAKMIDLRYQIFSAKDFQLLTKFATWGRIEGCTITDDSQNGNGVLSLEDLLYSFRKARFLILTHSKIFPNPMRTNIENIVNLCSTIENFHMCSTPASLDIRSFYECLKKAECRAKIHIQSFAEVETINEIIKEILESDPQSYVPPVILPEDVGDMVAEDVLALQKKQRIVFEKLTQ